MIRPDVAILYSNLTSHYTPTFKTKLSESFSNKNPSKRFTSYVQLSARLFSK